MYGQQYGVQQRYAQYQPYQARPRGGMGRGRQSSGVCCLICSVPEQHVLIITRLGKFDRMQFAGGGITCYNPFLESMHTTVSLLLQTLRIELSTKTSDHTFMKIQFDIQYRRLSEKELLKASVFKLDKPLDQMTAYVEDVVRSAVNKLTLDEVYREKSAISDEVKNALQELMTQFGYEIVTTPITELSPEDDRVLQAMNKVLELERKLVAQEQANERTRTKILLKADAERVQYVEGGKGLAEKRAAIVDGLRESVASFSKGMSGVTSKDVLEMILVTQYFDMLKDISKKSTGNSIFIKHGPTAVPDVIKDIRAGFDLANTPNFA